MTLEDQFRLLVGGYYGIQEQDEYDLKVYILKQVENYIQDFVKDNPIPDFDYKKEAEQVEEISLKRKLQDSISVIRKIDGPLDLELLIRGKLKKMDEKRGTF